MKQNKIRIIGGKYRSRKISFPEFVELRPTADRIRETLFNWLSPYIVDATCLDLFAGSGVLGLEALSRGAKHATFIEKNALSSQSILENAKLLQETNLSIITQDVLTWLKEKQLSYDVIFLDPPYQSTLLENSFTLLYKNNIIKDHALIYFEFNSKIDPSLIPKDWEVIHQKKGGQIYYYLAQKINNPF